MANVSKNTDNDGEAVAALKKPHSVLQCMDGDGFNVQKYYFYKKKQKDEENRNVLESCK